MNEKEKYPRSFAAPEDKSAGSGKEAAQAAGVYAGPGFFSRPGGKAADFRTVYAAPVPAPQHAIRIGRPDASDGVEGMRDGPGSSKADFLPKYCAYCGTELFPRAKYCTECGKKVKTKALPFLTNL